MADVLPCANRRGPMPALAAFCATCGAARRGKRETARVNRKSTRPSLIVIIGGGFIVLTAGAAVVGAVALLFVRDEPAAKPPTPAAAVRAVPAPPAAVEPPEKSLEQIYDEQITLPDALDLAIVEMKDTRDEESKGTLRLTRWATTHMTLADVAVAKNETTFKLAMKDSDAALGKRLCIKGRLISIARVPGAPVFGGLLNTGTLDIVSFFAVQSTGSLVEGSRARFCGVVTGRYSYANTGGGTTHAVKAVGVFDLTENIVASLETIEKAACACRDRACTDRLRQQLDVVIDSSTAPLPKGKAMADAKVVVGRAKTCLAAMK